MRPLDVSINMLARDIDVPPNRISEIVNGRRAITTGTALRLGKYFGASAEIWLDLQSAYELRAARREQAKVPETTAFATKPAIAVQLLEQLKAAAPLPHVVIADAGYGVDTAFRERLTALGFQYIVGITGAVSVWPEGRGPLHAKALALQLPASRFRTVTWREGTNTMLSSRFAAPNKTLPHPIFGEVSALPDGF